MNEHYYSKEQSVESAPKFLNFTLREQSMQFKTDNGVFSKGEVDFGSKLLIETFEFPNSNGDFLDVGCGYGPIGLSLAKGDSSRTVHMVDVNERALNLAAENAQLNQIHNVAIYESSCLDRVAKNDFIAILTNPPIRAGKKIVHTILEDSFNHLQAGGELWVVIQKKQGAPSAIELLKGIFAEVEVVEKKKGYFIIKATKHLT
ncbi:class I SAM-dependent methyltransferase [Pseudoneobacillus rhizosphaerae]|uniref:Ribosomal RNA small subunit methyltransferase C n=1 Tax=Pseudoneobacillus rhizosphaerae TaxID=2880968 RepID=A0A9C7GCZ2_9BACI|nr:class I SAM-dependent methyltransferase [Pseudoneobacillus rhizosphaerae]CAG9610028.1 Ribosomal RNA small subunit methyltransferase C [Pseudoneobacillus rhizosphaerae]